MHTLARFCCSVACRTAATGTVSSCIALTQEPVMQRSLCGIWAPRALSKLERVGFVLDAMEEVVRQLDAHELKEQASDACALLPASLGRSITFCRAAGRPGRSTRAPLAMGERGRLLASSVYVATRRPRRRSSYVHAALRSCAHTCAQLDREPDLLTCIDGQRQ